MTDTSSPAPVTIEPSAVQSTAPVTLPSRDRGTPLEVRVSAPLAGTALPVIIFSHGNGQSLYAYGPLANHWAARGFVVIQPTHMDSRMLALPADDPRRAQLWRYREQDLVAILDSLPELENAVSFIKGRIDHRRIAAAGHSWGAQTASMLVGATHSNPDDHSRVTIRDDRVKAAVLLTVPGTGGANLSEFAAKNFPFMDANFTQMIPPVLIVAGDDDHGAMTVRGPDWWREAYDFSPAPKSLFTVFGGQHSLGGIPNYEARETTDESPARLAAVQALSTAFLRSALYPGDDAWDKAVEAIRAADAPQGSVETK